MSQAMAEDQAATACGSWPLLRYNPDREDAGENPFQLDSGEPNGKLREYMMGEVRFASLTRTFPERAEMLFAEAEKFTAHRYAKYKRLAGQAGSQGRRSKTIKAPCAFPETKNSGSVQGAFLRQYKSISRQRREI